MKKVLISIQPKWCKLIAEDKKTIEVRKSRPNIETPFTCLIYCTKERLTKLTINMQSYLHVNEERVQKGHGKITTWSKIGDVLVNPTWNEYISYGMHGKVIGEFTCDKTNITTAEWVTQEELKKLCLTQEQLKNYSNKKAIYLWHISDLKIYDVPKSLSEFGLERPPQSWRYIEV